VNGDAVDIPPPPSDFIDAFGRDGGTAGQSVADLPHSPFQPVHQRDERRADRLDGAENVKRDGGRRQLLADTRSIAKTKHQHNHCRRPVCRDRSASERDREREITRCEELFDLCSCPRVVLPRQSDLCATPFTIRRAIISISLPAATTSGSSSSRIRESWSRRTALAQLIKKRTRSTHDRVPLFARGLDDVNPRIDPTSSANKRSKGDSRAGWVRSGAVTTQTRSLFDRELYRATE